MLSWLYNAAYRHLFNQYLEDNGGSIVLSAAQLSPGFLDSLSKGASVDDRNGLTRAGRALQKHANRVGDPWSRYLPANKSAAEYNRLGQEIVDEILRDPQSTFVTKAHNGQGYGGWVTFVTDSQGRKIWFNAFGELIGFL